VQRGGATESAYYFACNRSKQSVTVNLRAPEGQTIIRDLAREADVFLENFPVGTLKRYGLDYGAIRAVNERIVYVSCTGFGQSGPFAHRKGYDTIFQAMGGIMSLTGERDGPPVKPGLPFADLTSGLWVAIAILAGLQGRGAGTHGCHIDFSMLDGQIALLTLAAARFFALGEVPPRLGTEHPGRVPSASFLCADGGYLHITVSDQHWLPLCRTLGLEAWGSESELMSNSGRLRRRDEVMARLTTAIAARARDELGAALDAAGVPQGPIRAVDEILTGDHTAARELVERFTHPQIGEFPALRVPLKFDGWDDPTVHRPPLLGEHTETVLAERLGLSRERIAQLKEAKAI
jgi:crotonobetainyl-CoA:carnitine CoA-transferase CaiB-like acyl-CoA transferase